MREWIVSIFLVSLAASVVGEYGDSVEYSYEYYLDDAPESFKNYLESTLTSGASGENYTVEKQLKGKSDSGAFHNPHHSKNSDLESDHTAQSEHHKKHQKFKHVHGGKNHKKGNHTRKKHPTTSVHHNNASFSPSAKNKTKGHNRSSILDYAFSSNITSLPSNVTNKNTVNTYDNLYSVSNNILDSMDLNELQKNNNSLKNVSVIKNTSSFQDHNEEITGNKVSNNTVLLNVPINNELSVNEINKDHLVKKVHHDVGGSVPRKIVPATPLTNIDDNRKKGNTQFEENIHPSKSSRLSDISHTHMIDKSVIHDLDSKHHHNKTSANLMSSHINNEDFENVLHSKKLALDDEYVNHNGLTIGTSNSTEKGNASNNNENYAEKHTTEVDETFNKNSNKSESPKSELSAFHLLTSKAAPLYLHKKISSLFGKKEKNSENVENISTENSSVSSVSNDTAQTIATNSNSNSSLNNNSGIKMKSTNNDFLSNSKSLNSIERSVESFNESNTGHLNYSGFNSLSDDRISNINTALIDNANNISELNGHFVENKHRKNEENYNISSQPHIYNTSNSTTFINNTQRDDELFFDNHLALLDLNETSEPDKLQYLSQAIKDYSQNNHSMAVNSTNTTHPLEDMISHLLQVLSKKTLKKRRIKRKRPHKYKNQGVKQLKNDFVKSKDDELNPDLANITKAGSDISNANILSSINSTTIAKGSKLKRRKIRRKPNKTRYEIHNKSKIKLNQDAQKGSNDLDISTNNVLTNHILNITKTNNTVFYSDFKPESRVNETFTDMAGNKTKISNSEYNNSELNNLLNLSQDHEFYNTEFRINSLNNDSSSNNNSLLLLQEEDNNRETLTPPIMTDASLANTSLYHPEIDENEGLTPTDSDSKSVGSFYGEASESGLSQRDLDNYLPNGSSYHDLGSKADVTTLNNTNHDNFLWENFRKGHLATSGNSFLEEASKPGLSQRNGDDYISNSSLYHDLESKGDGLPLKNTYYDNSLFENFMKGHLADYNRFSHDYSDDNILPTTSEKIAKPVVTRAYDNIELYKNNENVFGELNRPKSLKNGINEFENVDTSSFKRNINLDGLTKHFNTDKSKFNKKIETRRAAFDQTESSASITHLINGINSLISILSKRYLHDERVRNIPAIGNNLKPDFNQLKFITEHLPNIIERGSIYGNYMITSNYVNDHDIKNENHARTPNYSPDYFNSHNTRDNVHIQGVTSPISSDFEPNQYPLTPPYSKVSRPVFQNTNHHDIKMTHQHEHSIGAMMPTVPTGAYQNDRYPQFPKSDPYSSFNNKPSTPIRESKTTEISILKHTKHGKRDYINSEFGNNLFDNEEGYNYEYVPRIDEVTPSELENLPENMPYSYFDGALSLDEFNPGKFHPFKNFAKTYDTTSSTKAQYVNDLYTQQSNIDGYSPWTPQKPIHPLLFPTKPDSFYPSSSNIAKPKEYNEDDGTRVGILVFGDRCFRIFINDKTLELLSVLNTLPVDKDSLSNHDMRSIVPGLFDTIQSPSPVHDHGTTSLHHYTSHSISLNSIGNMEFENVYNSFQCPENAKKVIRSISDKFSIECAVDYNSDNVQYPGSGPFYIDKNIDQYISQPPGNGEIKGGYVPDYVKGSGISNVPASNLFSRELPTGDENYFSSYKNDSRHTLHGYTDHEYIPNMTKVIIKGNRTTGSNERSVPMSSDIIIYGDGRQFNDFNQNVPFNYGTIDRFGRENYIPLDNSYAYLENQMPVKGNDPNPSVYYRSNNDGNSYFKNPEENQNSNFETSVPNTQSVYNSYESNLGNRPANINYEYTTTGESIANDNSGYQKPEYISKNGPESLRREIPGVKHDFNMAQGLLENNSDNMFDSNSHGVSLDPKPTNVDEVNSEKNLGSPKFIYSYLADQTPLSFTGSLKDSKIEPKENNNEQNNFPFQSTTQHELDKDNVENRFDYGNHKTLGTSQIFGESEPVSVYQEKTNFFDKLQDLSENNNNYRIPDIRRFDDNEPIYFVPTNQQNNPELPNYPDISYISRPGY